MTERQWNPRYVAYAKAHDRTSEAMLEHDTIAWPGGKMAGFLLWMNDRWQEWYEARGLNGSPASSNRHVLSEADFVSFDRDIGAVP